MWTVTGGTGTPLPAVPIASGQTVFCFINGTFSQPGASATNTVRVFNTDNLLVQLGSATVNATVRPTLTIPSDLSVVKSVWPTSIDVSAVPATLHYTIEVTNNAAGAALYLGGVFTLRDQLSLIAGGVPLHATYVGPAICNATAGTMCLEPTPAPAAASINVPTASWSQFEQWHFTNAGLILPGGKIVLTYDVKIERIQDYNCINTGDGLRNRAFITMATGGANIGEQDPTNSGINTVANNTAISTDVAVFTGATFHDTDCAPVLGPGAGPEPPKPSLAITKTLNSPSPVAWGSTADYKIHITNASGANITLTSLTDYVQENAGTPLFKATLVSAACSGTSTGPQQLAGYYDTKTVWNGTPGMVVPPGGLDCNLSIKYSEQTCDTWDAGLPTSITNFIQLKYTEIFPVAGVPTPIVFVKSASANTPMKAADYCRFEVKKTVAQPNTKVVFGVPVHYHVEFINNETVPRKVGTLGDFLRIAQPNYATSLGINYAYTCVPTGTVTGFGAWNATGLSGQVSNSAVATQGLQLLFKHDVTFAPGAKVACDFSVTVQRPPLNARYCMSSALPQLENLALMDISPVFNPNMNWPPSQTYNPALPLPLSQPVSFIPNQPKNWHTIALPLPKCFHFEVNKTADPLTTSTTGGPIAYTVTVSNLGETLEGPPNTYPWVLRDQFLAPNQALAAATVPAVTLSCSAPDCGWLPLSTGTPYTPVFNLGIHKFPAQSSIQVKFTVNPPYNLQEVCNHASTLMIGPTADQDWYSYNHVGPVTTPHVVSKCVPVWVSTSLQVTKKARYLTPGTVPNPMPSFPLTVSCTAPGPTTTFNISDWSSPNPTTVPNIPAGSNCTITEGPSSTYPPPGCQTVQKLKIDGVIHPSPFTIMGITATPNPHVVEVQNSFDCPESRLIVKKIFDVPSWLPPIPPGSLFPVHLNCTVGPSPTVYMVMPASPLTPMQTTPLPVAAVRDSVCTATELNSPNYLLPIVSAGKCSWEVSYVPGPSVTIAAGDNQLTIKNTLNCQGPDVSKAFVEVVTRKITVVNGAITTTTGPVQMQLNCTSTPPIPYTLGPEHNFQYTAFLAASGSECKLTETSTPPVPMGSAANCHWVKSYAVSDNGVVTPSTDPNGATLILAPQSVPGMMRQYAFLVTNTLDCSGPPRTPTGQPVNAEPAPQPAVSPSTLPTPSPNVTPAEKPPVPPAPQPAAKPTEQPSVPPAPRPTTPQAQPEQKPVVTPSPQPAAKPVEQTAPKPAVTPTQQPAVKPVEQTAPRPAVTPTQQPAAKPVEQTAPRPAVTPSQQPAAKPVEQTAPKPAVTPRACPPGTVLVEGACVKPSR